MTQIDDTKKLVTASGKPVDLTPREYEVLVALAEAKGQVLSRAELTEKVFKRSVGIQSRALDQHIARLRSALGKEGASIVTVTGKGFRADGVTFKRPRMGKVLRFDVTRGQLTLKVDGKFKRGQLVNI